MNKRILYGRMTDIGWTYNQTMYACTFVEMGYISFDYKSVFSRLYSLGYKGYVEWNWLEDS